MENNYFPLLLGRKGGAEFSILDSFEVFEIAKYLSKLSRLEEETKGLKSSLILDLHKLIGGENDLKLKRILLNFKRDFFNERSVSKYLYLIKNYYNFYQKYEGYIQKLLDYNYELDRLRDIHKQKLLFSIEKLKEVSNQYFFKNGLLFSSDILSVEIDKSYFKNANNINKKNKRIFISILKYLTRSITKTTPFSSFNSLFFLENNNCEYVPITYPIGDSNFRITNLFFHYTRELLLNDFDFKKNLYVYPNNTICNDEKESNKFHFFVNNDNNESFKKLEKSPILNFIKDKTSTGVCSYSFLLKQIKTVTEENEDSIQSFIDNLLGLGFLHIEYPVFVSERNWIDQLLDYLIKKKDFEKSKKIQNLIFLLKNIQAVVFNIKEIKNKKERSQLLKDTYKEVSNFFIFFDAKTDFMRKVSPQNLLYEDTFSESTETISKKSMKKVSENLKQAFLALNNIPYKKSLKKFFGKILNEEHGEQVPLLKFYEEIYLKHSDSFSLTRNNFMSFQKSFQKIAHLIKEGGLLNGSIDLSDIIDDEKHEMTSDHISFGAYIQVVNENWEGIVLNSFSNGDGSNISRFLNHIPKTYIEEIKKYNIKTQGDKILSEITDASIHNTNVYPSLVNHTINIIDNNTLKKTYKPIDLSGINVFYDDKKGIILKNQENIEIVPKSFSLEGLERRSKLLQFLDIFNPTDTLGYQLYLQNINQLYENRLTQKEIVCIPRIFYGKNIIIQRKKWIVKKVTLIDLFKKSKENLEDYFLKINQWIIQNEIPKEVFITLEKRDLKKSQNDNYKPQYINFRSPIFVLLFIDLIKKGNENIEITEMYPNPNHIKKNGGYVKEYVLNIN